MKKLNSPSKKNVCVALEHHFYKFNNRYYTKLAFPYFYWSDYLSFFDKVYVVARVKEVSNIDDGFKLACGEGVEFLEMPDYLGPKDFFIKFPKLVKRACRYSRLNDKFILRSGNISNLIWIWLMVLRKDYLREYPGNVQEGISNFVGRLSLKRLLAKPLHLLAQVQGFFSKGNGFVSEQLVGVYGNRKVPNFIFSSFNIDEISVKKRSFSIGSSFNVISVGRLEREKSFDTLVNAIAISGHNMKLTLVGDGSQRADLERLCRELNVDARFTGSILDRQKLFNIIASHDIFVLPSVTEGMPRALLEAIAVKLPAIGSRVGGIPFVLKENYLFEPKDVNELKELLIKYANSEALRKENSVENFEKILGVYSSENQSNIKSSYWGRLYETSKYH